MKSVPRDLAAGSVVVVLVVLAFSPWWAAHRIFAPLDVLHEVYAPWSEGVAAPRVHNHFTSDAVTQYLVYRRVAERAYASDGAVGWSDLTGGGRPEYANTMATYGDWTVQLHRWLPFWTAWHLGLMAQLVVAGLGMLVFLRSRGISRGVAVVGAVAFAFNTQFVVWAYHRWQLGAFAWVPWLAWAALGGGRLGAGEPEATGGATGDGPRRSAAWVLPPVFLALALLGGNLQTNALVLLAALALWMGSGPGRAGDFALWTALGLGLAAFSLVPGALALAETTGSSGGRVGFGYPGGAASVLGSAALVPLQLVPSLLGSPRSLDLTKALGLDLYAVAFFGSLPTVVAYRAALMSRAPAAARWLVALGVLLPLTPLAGLLYHRVQVLFAFGGAWAFAWWWDQAGDDPGMRWLPRAVAAFLALWLAGSLASVALEPGLTARLRIEVGARLSEGGPGTYGAGLSAAAQPAWMLERAARLIPELRLWAPRQLAVVVALVGSVAALGARGRRWAPALLGASVALELGAFAAGWVTFADPERYPPYPATPDLAEVQRRTEGGRVWIADDDRAFVPPNTLAMYGVATLQEYESVEVDGMWPRAGRPTDAASLARMGVTHALARPGHALDPGWTCEFQGRGLVLWRNDHPAPRYAADGGGPVRVLEATASRRRLEVPAGASSLRVAENWGEGWRYRVRPGPWRPVAQASDGSMVMALAPEEDVGAASLHVEMDYAPVRRTMARCISAIAALALAALALARGRTGAGRGPRGAAASFMVLGLLALIAALPSPAAAQATPYVPPLDPAYRDVEALVSAGLVRSLVMGQRPWSRLAFARAAAEARGRVQTGGTALEARFAEALARLEATFADAARPLRVRRAGADLSAMDAPTRAIPTLYTPVNEVAGRNLEGGVAPFLQAAQGRVMDDTGLTLGVETLTDVTLGRRVAGQLQPRAWALSTPGGGRAVDAALLGGYARTLLGNVSLEAGRAHARHGHARVYGVAFSDNARGLDMLRISIEEPRRLPWVLRVLGPTRFALWAADMGQDHDTPGSKLVVMEAALRPHPGLELGGALLNHQGGRNAPKATWSQRLRDLLFLERRPLLPFAPNGEFSDKVLAVDARLDLPGLGATVYVEGMTTDDHNLFLNLRQGLWVNAAWTAGARITGLGRDRRTDLWGEASHAGVRTYTHHQFTSGMALDGRVLGSPAGPLTTAAQGGVTWNGPRETVALTGAWERYAGDRYALQDDQWAEWLRTTDNPDEIRLRATLDWERAPSVTGLRTSVRLGYEHVSRFAFTDRSRSNFLAQVGVGWRW